MEHSLCPWILLQTCAEVFESFATISSKLLHHSYFSILDNYHFHQNEPGVVDLSLSFKNSIDAPITLLSYAIYDKVVSITKDMEVSISYAK